MKKGMETYNDIKLRHQKEVNALPIGAAFGEDQFKKMMENWGLTTDKEDLKKIVSLGNGCYIQKKDVPLFNMVSHRHRAEMEAFTSERKNLKHSFIYEFKNHESQFRRHDEEILACFGFTPASLEEDEDLAKIYDEAWNEFIDLCDTNDWY